MSLGRSEAQYGAVPARSGFNPALPPIAAAASVVAAASIVPCEPSEKANLALGPPLVWPRYANGSLCVSPVAAPLPGCVPCRLDGITFILGRNSKKSVPQYVYYIKSL